MQKTFNEISEAACSMFTLQDDAFKCHSYIWDAHPSLQNDIFNSNIFLIAHN